MRRLKSNHWVFGSFFVLYQSISHLGSKNEGSLFFWGGDQGSFCLLKIVKYHIKIYIKYIRIPRIILNSYVPTAQKKKQKCPYLKSRLCTPAESQSPPCTRESTVLTHAVINLLAFLFFLDHIHYVSISESILGFACFGTMYKRNHVTVCLFELTFH